jgi:hypothetical protein
MNAGLISTQSKQRDLITEGIALKRQIPGVMKT